MRNRNTMESYKYSEEIYLRQQKNKKLACLRIIGEPTLTMWQPGVAKFLTSIEVKYGKAYTADM